MAKKSGVGIGPTNIMKAIILTAGAYFIFGSFWHCLTFFGFYILYTIVGQIFGFESKG